MKRLLLALSLFALCPSSLALNASDTDAVRRIELNVLRGIRKPEDLNTVQSIVARNPKDARAHFIAAETLNNSGFQNLAVEQFDACEKIEPGFFLSRYKAMMSVSPDSVYPISHYAIKRYPDDSSVLYIQARHAMDKHRDGAAGQFFEKALAANPVWQGVYVDLCQLLLRQNRTHEALKYAELAIKQDPESYAARSVRAVASAKITGKPETQLSELARLAPEKWTNEQVTIALAHAYARKNDYSQAIVPAIYAMKYGNARTLQEGQDLLIAIAAHGFTDQVISDLDRVSPPNGKDMLSTVVRMRVARVLSESGRHKDATRLLLQALQMNSFFAPAINYRLAHEWEAQGEHAHAIFCYQSAHRLDPADREYKDAYLRAASRYQNKDNDLARRLKFKLNPTARG